MTRFLSIHTLTPSIISNRNSGRDGLPKTAPIGDAIRTRLSSQHIVRGIKEDARFQGLVQELALPLTIQSRLLFNDYVYQPLLAKGVDQSLAFKVTQKLEEHFLGKDSDKKEAERTKAKSRAEEKVEKAQVALAKAETDAEAEPTDKKLARAVERAKKRLADDEARLAAMGDHNRYLLNEVRRLTKVEMDYIYETAEMVVKAVAEGTKLDTAVNDAKKGRSLSTVRLGIGFDALLGGEFTHKIHGAQFCGHAFAVNRSTIEPDPFTAIDEITREVATGAAHMNNHYFSSDIHYHFMALDVKTLQEGLREHLGVENPVEVVKRFIKLLIELRAVPPPGAKKSKMPTFDSARFMLIEVGNQALQLDASFLRYVDAIDGDLLAGAYNCLSYWWREMRTNLDHIQSQAAMMAMGPQEYLKIDVPKTSILGLQDWASKVAFGEKAPDLSQVKSNGSNGARATLGA